jgi:hypothetical protein
MLSGIDKFRKQIAAKHRLYEPDWPSSGHLADPQSRRETLDVKLTPDCGRGQMLSLGLGSEAEPHGLFNKSKQGG